MQWEFWKLHGLGNDYLYFDVRGHESAAVDWSQLARDISDRHFGVGADGIITVGSSYRADARMVIFNADGSRSEMCGNGLRALSKWLYDRGFAGRQQVVETDAGLLYPEVVEEWAGRAWRIRVNMGAPRFLARDSGLRLVPGDQTFLDQELPVEGGSLRASVVSMGNPHLIVFGDRWDSTKMAEWGPMLEHHPWFPRRINVHSVQVIDPHHLAMRHWERGAGMTLACGTGVAATAACAIRLGRATGPLVVDVPGGSLDVEWDGHDESPVFLTGPAEEVFHGVYEWPH